jgi:hypothetical protein
MNKTVDIYLPLDSREGPNRVIWPVAMRQLKELVQVTKKCGWTSHVLNPTKPVSSVAEGMQVIKKAKGERFINFMAGWAYPDFSASPMWQLPADVPKLLLGSVIQDFPGNVGLFAAASGTAHVGIKTDRLFVDKFENHDDYAEALNAFLNKGRYQPSYPKTIEVAVGEKHRQGGRPKESKKNSRARSTAQWGRVPCRCGTRSPKQIF